MPNDAAELDFDLGVDIQETSLEANNLFEQFHSNQKDDNNPVPLNIKHSKAPEGIDSGSDKTSDKIVDKKDTKSDPPPVDKNAVLEMIQDSHSKPDDKTAGAAAGATQPSSLTAVYEHLTSELGFPALAEGETFDGTDDSFVDWFDSVKNDAAMQAANQMITDAFTNQKHNEELAKDFFRFISNGGDVESFLETRKTDTITDQYLTTDDEDLKEIRSEKMLRELHASMGWEPDAIEKYIASLKKSGTLEVIAETALPQFIKQRNQRKAATDQRVVATKQRSDAEIREHNNKIFATIDSSKEFSTFNIAAPKEKQRIKEYMYAPTVDIGNGQVVPQFVADKMLAAKNPQYTLFQALHLMNKGLDMNNVKDKIENKVKNSLKDKLEAAAQGAKLEQPSNSQANGSRPAQTENFIDFDNIVYV